MPIKINIIIKDTAIDAEFFDTSCARAISAALPIVAVPNEWGDEFYFEIPITEPLDDTATTEVKVGAIGYWPPGNALAIFFGPTPMSKGNDPVPASAVNLVGAIKGEASILRRAKGAAEIRIVRV